jgi:hypothetical protein
VTGVIYRRHVVRFLVNIMVARQADSDAMHVWLELDFHPELGEHLFTPSLASVYPVTEDENSCETLITTASQKHTVQCVALKTIALPAQRTFRPPPSRLESAEMY